MVYYYSLSEHTFMLCSKLLSTSVVFFSFYCLAELMNKCYIMSDYVIYGSTNNSANTVIIIAVVVNK